MFHDRAAAPVLPKALSQLKAADMTEYRVEKGYGIVMDLVTPETTGTTAKLLLRAQNKFTILFRIRIKIVDFGQIIKRSE
jgi:hypothetical protein